MTASEPLARELEEFLEAFIDSYEHLAVLLLLID